MTQRERVERLLTARGPRGVHSFEFYGDGMPRAAVVVSRLKRAGWEISAVPEPSPSGGQGVRYIVRSRPGDRSAEPRGSLARLHPACTPTAGPATAGDSERLADALSERRQLALDISPPASAPASAIFDCWGDAA